MQYSRHQVHAQEPNRAVACHYLRCGAGIAWQIIVACMREKREVEQRRSGQPNRLAQIETFMHMIGHTYMGQCDEDVGRQPKHST